MIAEFFVADSENTVPKSTLYADGERNVASYTLDEMTEAQKMDAANDTRVWLHAIVPVSASPDYDEVVFDDDIDGAINSLSKIKSGIRSRAAIGFYHNLSYDGPLITDRLLRQGYTFQTSDELHQKNKRGPERGCFTMNMSEKGKIYSIKIRFANNGNMVELRDSANIMPGSVDSIAKTTNFDKLKGTVDYAKPRPVGYVADEIERKYAANDVLIISQALHNLFEVAPLLKKKQTIGGAALEYLKRSLVSKTMGLDIVEEAHWTKATDKYKDDYFDAKFSGEIIKNDDPWFRKAYAGGFTYVNRQNCLISRNQIVDTRHLPFSNKGQTYDVNSLYPSVMFDHEYPVGEPVWRDPKSFRGDHPRPYYVEFNSSFKVKKDHIPFIQLKGNSLFGESEHVRDSMGIVSRVMSKPDFELFVNQYDIEDLEIVKWCDFNSEHHIFDDFVSYFYHIKETSTGARKLFAKLMLNNCYGKLAQGPDRPSGYPYLDDDGVLRILEMNGDSSGAYIPIGAYITAYARNVTIRAAQNNFASFLYADTDSIHLAGPAKGINIDPNKIGAWDHESTWDLARFTRQKGYIERIVDPKTQKPLPINVSMIKAAGASDASKERMLFECTNYNKHTATWNYEKFDGQPRRSDMEILTRFTHGLHEAGKLMRRRVTGGVILQETTFSIHAVDGVTVDLETGLAPTLISKV